MEKIIKFENNVDKKKAHAGKDTQKKEIIVKQKMKKISYFVGKFYLSDGSEMKIPKSNFYE